MNLNNNHLVKNLVILISPLLLFAILLIPYSWINQQFIVNWFGCSCPTVDELGNIVRSDFNANDFTALFWLFISCCTATISVFLSKIIPKEKMWLRVAYIVGMFLISLYITNHFCKMMMWK